MRIHADSIVRHPLQIVYAAYRDRLPDIARTMPDVREVQVISREVGDPGPVLHNLWIADRDVPRVVAAVVRPEMLRWDDYARWNDAETHVDWRLSIPAFR